MPSSFSSGGMKGANTSSISDHHRAKAGLFADPADLASRGARLGFVVDEGQPQGLEWNAVELGQHAVTDGLGGDAGAI